MEAILEASPRDTFGKNEARRTRARRAGAGGAVRRGDGGRRRTATPIAVDPKALLKILHSESGANTLISLKLPGAADARVLVKEYQLDPVTHQLLHADFYRVAMDRVLQVTIPVVVKGEPKGVKQQGGILEFVRREIEIECLPADIPEHIDIDVTELMLHQGIRVRDVAGRPEVDAGQRPRDDARPRDRAEGRGSGRAGRRRRGGRAGGAGRARSHQEGQEGGGGEKRRNSRSRREADRRPRQPGSEVPRRRATTSASRSSTSWPGARASASSRRPADALVAKVRGRRARCCSPSR